MKTNLAEQLLYLFNSNDSEVKSYEDIPVQFLGNQGADSKALDLIQTHFLYQLPNDYIDFLKYFDGCQLFLFENLDGFNFLGTNNIIAHNTRLSEDYDEEWENNIIVFCECVGEGNYLGFRILNNNSYEVIDCFHEEVPANWGKISSSFEDLLEKLINYKGKKFWLESNE
jgi:hypothetical protein